LRYISSTTPYKIINIKSDNGIEYIIKNLINFLESNVINFIHTILEHDFTDIYSPTIQANSLRLIVATASINNWDIKQLIKIYTKIPLGVKNYNKKKYWLLKKLYMV
jgi:hypothetical protein